MKRTRRRRLGIAGALAATFAVIFVASGIAAPVVVHAGNLVVTIAGHTTPTALPKDKMAPVGFEGSASVATEDGTHIPPAESTELLIDKHIGLDTTGLPTCSIGQLKASPPAAVMKACGDALLGRGTSTAQVAFPEQATFDAKGPLLFFNGPRIGGAYGYNEQLYYVYAHVPLPTALIAVGKVSRASGRYGYKIDISIPKIAGGAGSFQSAEFKIDRKWTYKGKKHSFLNAECANGHFVAQVGVDFGDGSELTGDVINPCKSLGG